MASINSQFDENLERVKSRLKSLEDNLLQISRDITDVRSLIHKLEDSKIRFKETFMQGYETGLTWKDRYIPGGPFISTARPTPWSTDREKKAYEDSYRNHREYMIGFRAGIKQSRNELFMHPGVINYPDIGPEEIGA